MSSVEDQKGWTPRQRAWAAWGAVWSLLALPAAITSGWSLVAAQGWSWDRYWSLFFPIIVAVSLALISDILVRHDLLTLSAKERRKRERDREMARALNSMSLPPGADTNEWTARLQRRLRTFVALAFCLLAVWGAAVVLTALAAHFTSRDDRSIWVLAAVVLLLGVPLICLLGDSFRRGRSLLAAVRKTP